jgi:hypothetical protein
MSLTSYRAAPPRGFQKASRGVSSKRLFAISSLRLKNKNAGPSQIRRFEVIDFWQC